MNQHELNALRIENDRLKKDNDLMRELSSTEGFYRYFFKNLKNFKTNGKCFEHANDEYMRLFGNFRYESYGSFRVIMHKKNKVRK